MVCLRCCGHCSRSQGYAGCEISRGEVYETRSRKAVAEIPERNDDGFYGCNSGIRKKGQIEEMFMKKWTNVCE